MKTETGQVILLLILVMTVALAIGLSIVQKSLVDVSTASKVEQSSRAFSAAEAGIEKALQESNTTVHNTPEFTGTSSQVTQIVDTGLIPVVPTDGSRQAALEYPPLAKEEVAQVWLADFNSISNPPLAFYTQNILDIYWGNSTVDKAALELTLVYYDGTKYTSKKRYLDPDDSRRTVNGFEQVSCTGNYSLTGYQCKKPLDYSSIADFHSSSTYKLMLIRARLLYNTTSQPFAVQATGIGVSCTGTTGGGCYLPLQARIIVSTGASGETQRKVKIFQNYKVALPYFDYAIFSAGTINKNEQ